MSDFSKYQLSKFLDGKRDYQVVVRSDDFDDLLACMKNMKILVEQIEKKEQTTPVNQPGLQANCETCGTKMEYKEGMGKKGPWKGLFCPNSDKNNRNTHKPIWL